MLTKKITTLLTTAGMVTLLVASPLSAFAQTVSPTRGENQSARLSNLNTLCQNAVTQRVTLLNSVESRIGTLKRLSSSQQQQYQGEVTTNSTGLQGVATQCTTDFNAGNLTNLRNDYRSIFTQYRIYVEMLPQMRLLIASDTMGYTASNLNTLYGKLQSRVQSAGNPGNLTGLLTDMQTKINTAQMQYTSVESQVTGLTPTSYDQNPSGTNATFQTARSEIKTGAADLQSAWSDAKQIIQILKTLPTSTTITPAPSGS